MAFPTNDFRQEKGTNEEIQNFVTKKFPEATFPLFSKVTLSENSVFHQLHEQVAGDIKGNFFKYLVNRKGVAVRLYNKKQPPLSFENEIKELLSDTWSPYD